VPSSGRNWAYQQPLWRCCRKGRLQRTTRGSKVNTLVQPRSPVCHELHPPAMPCSLLPVPSLALSLSHRGSRVAGVQAPNPNLSPIAAYCCLGVGIIWLSRHFALSLTLPALSSCCAAFDFRYSKFTAQTIGERNWRTRPTTVLR
jgi:hypothetical protein